MGIVEIILIIAGAVICILGYLMPARKEDMDETLQLIGEDEVRKVVDKEVEEALYFLFPHHPNQGDVFLE